MSEINPQEPDLDLHCLVRSACEGIGAIVHMCPYEGAREDKTDQYWELVDWMMIAAKGIFRLARWQEGSTLVAQLEGHVDQATWPAYGVMDAAWFRQFEDLGDRLAEAARVTWTETWDKWLEENEE